jgi:hypothetical protein
MNMARTRTGHIHIDPHPFDPATAAGRRLLSRRDAGVPAGEGIE